LVLSPVILELHPIGTLGKLWRPKHSLHSFHSALLFCLIPSLVGRHRSTSCQSWTQTNSQIHSLGSWSTSISHGVWESVSCSSLHDGTAYHSGIFSGSLSSVRFSLASFPVGCSRSSYCLVVSSGGSRYTTIGRHSGRRRGDSSALPRTRKFNSSSSCRSGYHCFVCSSSHDRQLVDLHLVLVLSIRTPMVAIEVLRFVVNFFGRNQLRFHALLQTEHPSSLTHAKRVGCLDHLQYE
jgi:hypothetical protein